MTKEKIQSRITEIHNEIKCLQSEEKELRNKLKEIVTLENTKLILSSINDVTGENSMVIRLYSDTRTTPIMENFYNSDRKYLIFDRIFSIGNNFSKVSLIITKATKNVAFVNSGLTMTDLKKHSNIYVTEGFLSSCPDTARFYTLAKELIIASKKITDNTRIQFENLIRLGGQTYSNQTGYGSTYEGTHQLTQGTLYGDTTTFYIIGIILSDML